MRRVPLAAAAALALAGCAGGAGQSPLYAANSSVSAVNMLINSLAGTAGALNRARCGGAPCPPQAPAPAYQQPQPYLGRTW